MSNETLNEPLLLVGDKVTNLSTNYVGEVNVHPSRHNLCIITYADRYGELMADIVDLTGRGVYDDGSPSPVQWTRVNPIEVAMSKLDHDMKTLLYAASIKKKIFVVKYVRKITGLGLVAAKRMVEVNLPKWFAESHNV